MKLRFLILHSFPSPSFFFYTQKWISFVNNTLMILAAILCILWIGITSSNWQIRFYVHLIEYFFHNNFCGLCHSAKNFPWKNWEQCNFFVPSWLQSTYFWFKNLFVQFSEIVLLRGRIFRSLKSIFKRFLFAIIWYFGNNNRQHP